MGVVKALVPVGGKRMIDRVLEVGHTVSDDVFLVGRIPPELQSLGVPRVTDRWLGLGPIGGLAAALVVARHDLVGCFACDMPFLSRGVVELLYELIGDADVVGIQGLRGWEPLCALYRPEVLSVLEEMVEERCYILRTLDQRCTVRVITVDELLSWGIDPRRTMNVNTPEQLHEAEQIAPQLDGMPDW